MTVTYAEIVGFPGYRVGDDGTIWRLWITCRSGRKLGDRWREMKLNSSSRRSAGRRYLTVNLTPPCGGKYTTFRVHRLVLEAFVGPCPPEKECRHLDGDPSNNRLSNLVWGSRDENAADNKRLGRYRRGESSPQAKLTKADVAAIRSKYNSGGFRLIDLAVEYHVSLANVHAIVKKRSWRTVD